MDKGGTSGIAETPDAGQRVSSHRKYKVQYASKSLDKPILAHFSNGHLCVGKLEAETQHVTNAALYRNAIKRKETLVVETADMQYEGSIDSSPRTPLAKKQCKLLVGVIDKTSGVLTISDVNEYVLNPSTLCKASKKQSSKNTSQTDSFRDKADELSLQFGDKRSRRSVQSRRSNQVMGDAIEHGMDVASTYILTNNVATDPAESHPADALDGEEVSESDSWVKVNWAATSPEDAYQLDDIIPGHIVEEISDYIRGDGEWSTLNRTTLQQMFKESTYPRCVLMKLGGVVRDLEAAGAGAANSSATGHERMCKLFYISLLLRLYKMKNNEINRKVLQVHSKPLPHTVQSHIENNFTIVSESNQRKRRQCPSRLKDKCMCHILVLLLTLSNYSMNANDIITDTSINVKRLQDLARHLGCTVSKDKLSGSHHIVVNVPLKKPVATPFKRQRGGRT